MDKAKAAIIEKLRQVAECFLEKQLDATLEDCRRCRDIDICNILEEVYRVGFEEGEEYYMVSAEDDEDEVELGEDD